MDDNSILVPSQQDSDQESAIEPVESPRSLAFQLSLQPPRCVAGLISSCSLMLWLVPAVSALLARNLVLVSQMPSSGIPRTPTL